MIVPTFLKKDDLIGITACSCGVLKKIDRYEMSIDNFKKNGFKIIETDNVRTMGPVSSDKETRIKELNSLYDNQDVKLISIASGGDYLYDILTLLDFEKIQNNVKWVSGSSDPTSLLYIITTNLDIATIYSPCNMCGYDMKNLHVSLANYMKLICGENVKQLKSEFYEKSEDDNVDGYNLVTENKWHLINTDSVDETGITIGGCIECLKDIIGTKFDKTIDFIEKYKDNNIIWYFDVFAMPFEVLHNTLLQFNNAGWFKYTDLILIGKVKYPNTEEEIEYVNAIKSALSDVKIVFCFDIGHVKPSFTMFNGLTARVVVNDEEGSLEYLF